MNELRYLSELFLLLFSVFLIPFSLYGILHFAEDKELNLISKILNGIILGILLSAMIAGVFTGVAFMIGFVGSLLSGW